MSRLQSILIGFLFIFIAALPAQKNDFQIEVNLGGSIPLGPTLENGQEIYKIGPILQGSGIFPVAPSRGLYGIGKVGYLSSQTYADMPLTAITIAPGMEYRHQIGRLLFGAQAFTGMYLGMFEGESGMDLVVQGGPFCRFLVNPNFSLGITADYSYCFADSFSRDMYSGVQISLGTVFSPGTGGQGPEIDYREIQLQPVYPVFYTYYDTHPLGSIILENSSPTDVKELEVTFYTPEYMERPKECASFTFLEAGARIEVPLYGLFNKDILTTTEGTKVPGEIVVSYSYLGKRLTSTINDSLEVKNRNAMSWDDDRKAASFVTSRDEDVLRFAKSTASYVRDSESLIVNRTFRIAMGMFRALDSYGIRYVIDPVTPYKSFSQDTTAIDYLQFPAQTLSFHGGDCDDLTILYAALLESVGIETAFITVPGHIYLAFNAEIEPDEAPKFFINKDDLILTEGKTWVPIEITMLRSEFLEAWREGAKKWRKNDPDGLSGFLPVRTAWETYEPVDRPPLNSRVIPFDPVEMEDEFKNDLDRMTAFQLQDRVRELNAVIARGGKDRQLYINKLGLLYARYGLYEKAEQEFMKIAGTGYYPALLNLGNIKYLRGEYQTAMDFYQQALNVEQDSALAMLYIARVHYEMEDYDAANTAYLKVRQKDPVSASRFSYLASSARDSEMRAADSEIRKEVMIWDD